MARNSKSTLAKLSASKPYRHTHIKRALVEHIIEPPLKFYIRIQKKNNYRISNNEYEFRKNRTQSKTHGWHYVTREIVTHNLTRTYSEETRTRSRAKPCQGRRGGRRGGGAGFGGVRSARVRRRVCRAVSGGGAFAAPAPRVGWWGAGARGDRCERGAYAPRVRWGAGRASRASFIARTRDPKYS